MTPTSGHETEQASCQNQLLEVELICHGLLGSGEEGFGFYPLTSCNKLYIFV